MFKSLFHFHKELITPTSTISSSRYLAVMTWYVASWILIYLTVKTTVLPTDIYLAYIGTFVLGYIGSKGIATFSQNSQNQLNTEQPTQQGSSDAAKSN